MEDCPTPTWQTTARVRLARLQTDAEQQRRAVLAAQDSAEASALALRKVDQHLDALRTTHDRTEIVNQRIADALLDREVITAQLADARAQIAEATRKASITTAIRERAEKALAAVRGVPFFSTVGV